MKRLSLFSWLFIFMISYAQSQEKLSLSIEQAKAYTLENNPDYQIQLKKITAQKGQYWFQIMPEDPQIGVEYEEIPKGDIYSRYNEKRLFITQTLDFPTNYFFKHKILRAEVQKGIAQLEKTKRAILFQVKEAYWKLVMTKELVQLAKENVKLSDDFYQRAVRSYELGETDKLTMLKAKVHSGASRTKLKLVQKDFEINHSHLKKVLAIDLPVEIMLTDTLPVIIKDFDKEQIIKCINIHPDMIMAELEQKVAADEKRLAYSSFLPSLSFTYFRQEIAKDDFWGGEIGLSLPLWLPGRAGIISQKEAEYLMANYNISAQKLKLQKEFEQAAVLLEKSIAEVKLYQRDLLKEAEEVFRIAQKSYAIGEIGYLDYIDAQKVLIETQEKYVTALFQYQIEQANLQQLTGIEK